MEANRPAIFTDVEAFFADPPPGLTASCATIEGNPGRLEIRRPAVCREVDQLFVERRCLNEPRFPGLAMIGMVEAEIECAGKFARERRYYLSSAKFAAKTFARAVRAHWQIENRLHWVLDVDFRDTLTRWNLDYLDALIQGAA